MGLGTPLPSLENIPICISMCRIGKDFFVDPTADEASSAKPSDPTLSFKNYYYHHLRVLFSSSLFFTLQLLRYELFIPCTFYRRHALTPS